ncbi:hypothetical protein ST37_16515 [Vibrio sp. qd031]|uniref:arsenate reductase/protein-tyrosine-phosphatase family protein n=1 Tax=Vibrio sp. qd031 TaxID=1603038 RepID=UPI000A0F5200|nr:ATP-grasp domain-containing protein [Vibrio sp. qd031]ORT48684.1 hypothetical protein ST37_16515 [Vibrio sp. qd031]
MSKRKRVLVIGEDSRSFLSSIRSLAKNEYEVHAISLNAQSIALRSQYLHAFKCVSQLANTESAWSHAITQYVTEHAIELIFPCDERAIFPLLELRKSHQDFPPCAIVNEDAFYVFLDKWKTKSVAMECDVPVADAHHVDNSSQIDLEAIELPVVFKPLQSYREDDIHNRGKVAIVRNTEQLKTLLDGQHQPFILEQYFEGTGEGLSVFAIEGVVKTAFAHQRLWESADGGGSSYRKSVEVDPAQLEAVKKLCAKTHMTGLAMFEFKRNLNNGKWILIEVNARVWGSIPLAVQSGIDFPSYFANYLTEPQSVHSDLYPKDYRVDQYARNLTSDFNMVRSQFQGIRRRKGILKAFKFLAVRTFEARRMLVGKERIDSFELKDTKPFFAELMGIVKLISSFINRKVPQLRLFYRPFVRATLRKKLGNGYYNSIYFLCYGNIVRSSFAEFDLKKKLTEDTTLSIHSVGIHDPTGRQSPDMFIEAAKQFDVDLAPHRSKHIRDFQLTDRDLVLFFDEKNQLFFEQNLAPAEGVNMTDLVGPLWFGRANIDDPYGKTTQDANDSYSMINAAVERLYNDISR